MQLRPPRNSRHWLLEELRRLEPQYHGFPAGTTILKVQGNLQADTLLVSPPPSLEDAQHGMVWSSKGAVQLNALFQAKLGAEFDFNRRCLILPSLFVATEQRKLSAKTCAPNVRLFQEALRRPPNERAILVGGDVFKFFVGEGKKPSLTMLAGTAIRMRQFGHKLVFVLPSPEALVVPSKEAFVKKRDYFKALDAQAQLTAWYIRMMPNFEAFMRSS